MFDDNEDAYNYYNEIYTDIIVSILNDFKNNKIKQSYSYVNKHSLKKVFLEYTKNGIVFSEKLLNKISELFVKNIIRLEINTKLCGHSSEEPRNVLFQFEDEISSTEEEVELFVDEYCFNENIGAWMISDYGLDPLLNLCLKLMTSTTCSNKIKIINEILQVVHQRFDLSAIFVKGGVDSLDWLSNCNTI